MKDIKQRMISGMGPILEIDLNNVSVEVKSAPLQARLQCRPGNVDLLCIQQSKITSEAY
jgi:hypothetical protein